MYSLLHYIHRLTVGHIAVMFRRNVSLPAPVPVLTVALYPQAVCHVAVMTGEMCLSLYLFLYSIGCLCHRWHVSEKMPLTLYLFVYSLLHASEKCLSLFLSLYSLLHYTLKLSVCHIAVMTWRIAPVPVLRGVFCHCTHWRIAPLPVSLRCATSVFKTIIKYTSLPEMHHVFKC